MKAVATNLLELLKANHRFVVPIYQRVYSWDEKECEQLWTDIYRAGARSTATSHFTGSIVYIEREEGAVTASEPNLIIDGQQRVTTVSLVLAALAANLALLPEDQREPIKGFSPEKIRGNYLTNPLETDDDFFKLMLSKQDRNALRSVVTGAPLPESNSRVVTNYAWFVQQLAKPATDLATVCAGLSRLAVVDVHLTRGVDDPQLVFEAMSATGKKLSQADLIRNFVLMDLPPGQQERTYENYWLPMEESFAGHSDDQFDWFVRHYLTLKTGSMPRIDQVYDAFKAFSFERERAGDSREDILKVMSRFSRHYGAMALDQERDPVLAPLFREVALLVGVAYPFTLQAYDDYSEGRLTRDDFATILRTIVSYVLRRTVCRVPTNSLNKTFGNMAKVIDPERYVESMQARLLSWDDYRRFPSDDEFTESLKTGDLYSLRRAKHVLQKLENHGRKEPISVSEYTIEHVMPQNANAEWQAALGPDWEATHDKYLHTLGNLTLTGYNPEYSDRPFVEKRDIEGGFRHSPLRLNEGLGQLEEWTAATIEARATRLAARALEVWSRPTLSATVLASYRDLFTDVRRFDWSQAHAMLQALPAGRWTSYHQLAEAVGTSAQPMAAHLMRCPDCANPHRVMTWDGEVADEFRWQDPEDHRDPIELLVEEGIRIDDSKADPEQQLSSEDLLALVGEVGTSEQD